jgi:Family of unknown function (DUF6225)
VANEELFDHQVKVMTALQLRKALEGVPDDFEVRVVTAKEPGGGAAEEQVAISAGWVRTGWRPDYFEIDCEFPPGQYYRRTDHG